MTVTSEARPVLMSRVIAERLGLMDRWDVVESPIFEGGLGVASVTEAELLVSGVTRVVWGEPDEYGYYVPVIFASGDAEWP